MKTKIKEAENLIPKLLKMNAGDKLFVLYSDCAKSGIKSSVKSAHKRMKVRGLKFRTSGDIDGHHIQVEEIIPSHSYQNN